MLLASLPILTKIELSHLYRGTWDAFPDVLIHQEESFVKKHLQYAAAKSGDSLAALKLVGEVISLSALFEINRLAAGRQILFLPVHALETEGVNVIPRVLARILGQLLKQPVASGIVQINRVSHTGASGYARLAAPALFDGEVQTANYFLVDDFIGQGGTLANLKGFIESRGGEVVGATTLTGEDYSRVLQLKNETLGDLRRKHGKELEEWWLAAFGYGFEKLTESEARYLLKADNAYAITTRLAEAKRN